MNRLFKLLDKVNNRPDAKDVHPALKQAVFAARERGSIRQRNLAFVAVALFSVILGGTVVYFLGGVK